MKKIILILFIFTIGMNICSAEEEDKNGDDKENRSYVIYSFFLNIVPDGFNFPLIGFVNIADGSHNSPQIGFINLNQKNFNGLQMSFVNTTGGGTNGTQLGFINTNAQSLIGSQIGFVNTTGGEIMKGLQLGFVNTSVHRTEGAQISFVNLTKQLHGFQLGFINYADEIDDGIPFGFISYIKKGGYKALEYGVSEISPITVSLKLGVEKLYTSLHFGYNPLKEDFSSAAHYGLGVGSIIRINNSLFFNPELVAMNTINGSTNANVSLIPYFGYKIASHLSIVAGPSITWIYSNDGIESPFFKIIGKEINEENQIFMGARLGLRLEW
ncbi:hypothetical protein LQZ19_16245 [Treponema primitia]|uniref:LA_2272 family surface repeat-containing protein n=1 Tax=Treponema primitia TaxID=88058 RepID=UPI00398123A3